MQSDGVGLTDVSVEGFQEDGDTGCLAAFFIGIIRSESCDKQVCYTIKVGARLCVR